MLLEKPDDGTEIVETTPESRRDDAWNGLQEFIKQKDCDSEPFQRALVDFARAHIDILIAEHLSSKDVAPYEFVRDTMAKLFKPREELDFRSKIFRQIRAVVTNEAAMRALKNSEQRTGDSMLGRNTVRHSHEDLVTGIIGTLVSHSADENLDLDPYRTINNELSNVLDPIEMEMAVARIVSEVTSRLITAAAPVTASDTTEEKILVQRGDVGIWIHRYQLAPYDRVIPTATPSTKDAASVVE